MSKSSIVFKQACNRCLDCWWSSESLPSEPELGQSLGGEPHHRARGAFAPARGRADRPGTSAASRVLREPLPGDYFSPGKPTRRPKSSSAASCAGCSRKRCEPGTQITEAELAREAGVGITSVREFLIRFGRFGLIEKRPNSRWRFKGFTRDFALELTEIREMFELRSAFAFAALGADHPAWAALDVIEDEHHAYQRLIATRFQRILGTGRAVPPSDPQCFAQPLHHRFLRRDRHDLPLPLSVEQGRRA